MNLTLAILCLFGCDRQGELEAYTETRIEWQGATAENIRDLVRTIAPGSEIAVIEDGEATLFHRGTVAETQKELDRTVGMRPNDLEVSPPVAKKGKLPELPRQEERIQILWEVDSAVAASHGIQAEEIANHLRELDFDHDEISSGNALRGKTFKTSSGAEIALDSLAKPKPTTVRRPIILNQ